MCMRSNRLTVVAFRCMLLSPSALSYANCWPEDGVDATSQDLVCNFANSFTLTREMPVVILLVG